MHKPYFIGGLITLAVGIGLFMVAADRLDEIEMCQFERGCAILDPETNQQIPFEEAKSPLMVLRWVAIASIVAGAGQALYGYVRETRPGEPTMHRLHKFKRSTRRLIGGAVAVAGAFEIAMAVIFFAAGAQAEFGWILWGMAGFGLLALPFGLWVFQYQPPQGFNRDAPEQHHPAADVPVPPPYFATAEPRARAPHQNALQSITRAFANPRAVADSSEATQLLKLRLARGELSEEEYLRLRELVES